MCVHFPRIRGPSAGHEDRCRTWLCWLRVRNGFVEIHRSVTTKDIEMLSNTVFFSYFSLLLSDTHINSNKDRYFVRFGIVAKEKIKRFSTKTPVCCFFVAMFVVVVAVVVIVIIRCRWLVFGCSVKAATLVWSLWVWSKRPAFSHHKVNNGLITLLRTQKMIYFHSEECGRSTFLTKHFFQLKTVCGWDWEEYYCHQSLWNRGRSANREFTNHLRPTWRHDSI